MGCYGRIPQTGWLIVIRNLLLTVLEAGSLRPGYPRGGVLGNPFSLVHSWPLLTASLHGGGGRRELSGASFFKDTYPTYEAPALMT